MRTLPTLLLVTALVAPTTLSSQQSVCDGNRRFALLEGVDRAYAPAQVLARELRRSGIVVHCLLRSHSDGLFDGMAGAAFVQSDHGSFDALFRPPGATFDSLVVVEQREPSGYYTYSFKGSPAPWPANKMESRQRMYFVKSGHRMFILWGDADLADRLRRAFKR
jgi:hypothetical protein